MGTSLAFGARAQSARLAPRQGLPLAFHPAPAFAELRRRVLNMTVLAQRLADHLRAAVMPASHFSNPAIHSAGHPSADSAAPGPLANEGGPVQLGGHKSGKESRDAPLFGYSVQSQSPGQDGRRAPTGGRRS